MAPIGQTDFLATLDKRVAQCWCMEPWTDAAHVPVQMDCCKQLAGTECIKQWVTSSAANHNKCPHCRQELFRKEGAPGSSPRQAPTAIAPLIWSEPSFPALFLRSTSARPLPIRQPAPAAVSPPRSSLGLTSMPIGGAVPILLPAAGNIGNRNEAFDLWKTTFAHPSLFERLWAHIQVKPQWPLAAETKWHYMVALLHSVIGQEIFVATRDGRIQQALALHGYLYHLERLPAQNLAHTEEHTCAILSTGPLFDCVDFMMMIVNLVHHMQPTHIMADTIATVMDNLYYGRDDHRQVSEWRSWDIIFGEAMSLCRYQDVPALRILTVLLLCNPLPVVKQAFGTNTSRYGPYDRRCLTVVDRLRNRLGLRLKDMLEELARMSDDGLLIFWGLA
ncbi:hypothetical protein P171DRAFT_427803 [Karstenula rhodostoma CBS 690.94]|uniref:RING-type domain-containing protein n=1 Tax=Karstenula rhodostoma CBS 690.94 TaxID=1392251 RepID=A0A9P4PSJ9_9PLEO|nr:hypothetical protein P171DRAFT_427803 [Karstenula rhodostoma CBS 690.94]